jgi:nucleoid-associated protein YgaU
VATGASVLPQEYAVKTGDSLSGLALRFYGSIDKWSRIYEANAKKLTNPNYIYIGQKLVIPEEGGRVGAKKVFLFVS